MIFDESKHDVVYLSVEEEVKEPCQESLLTHKQGNITHHFVCYWVLSGLLVSVPGFSMESDLETEPFHSEGKRLNFFFSVLTRHDVVVVLFNHEQTSGNRNLNRE